jgi:hypothetical protein
MKLRNKDYPIHEAKEKYRDWIFRSLLTHMSFLTIKTAPLQLFITEIHYCRLVTLILAAEVREADIFTNFKFNLLPLNLMPNHTRYNGPLIIK